MTQVETRARTFPPTLSSLVHVNPRVHVLPTPLISLVGKTHVHPSSTFIVDLRFPVQDYCGLSTDACHLERITLCEYVANVVVECQSISQSVTGSQMGSGLATHNHVVFIVSCRLERVIIWQ